MVYRSTRRLSDLVRTPIGSKSRWRHDRNGGNNVGHSGRVDISRREESALHSFAQNLKGHAPKAYARVRAADGI